MEYVTLRSNDDKRLKLIMYRVEPRASGRAAADTTSMDGHRRRGKPPRKDRSATMSETARFAAMMQVRRTEAADRDRTGRRRGRAWWMPARPACAAAAS